MDPVTVVGLVASIVQLIDATTKAIKYLNDVKDAPKDRVRLAKEATSLLVLLTDLRFRVEEAKSTDSWFAGVRSLGVKDGPLDQLKESMEELVRKLKPETTVENALLQAIKGDTTAVTKGFADQESRDIMTWISTLSFSTKQNDTFSRRQKGTGEWILKSDAFKNWLDGTERILWCPGLPGAGKTILTSIVVNYLKQSFEHENTAVAYIYCSYNERYDQTSVNLIASLMQQLVQRYSVIPNEIVSLYRHHIKNQTRPTLAEWSKLLQSEVHRLSKVFIVVDALDECSENNGTRDSFLAEIRKLQPSIHLLATSRHILTIEREFEGAARIEILANDEDVRKYVEGRIETERRLARHIEADPTLQDTIINTIVEKAKGMFLLAQLHMDSLAKKHNRKEVRITLKNLPKELNDTYDEAMQRISSQDEEDTKLAEQVLCWIIYAFKPLTITEVQHALAVEPGDVNFDEDALPDQDILVSVCAGLVTIDQESDIIRLVHYTAQEYFERICTTRFPYAQLRIATTCLLYISFDEFAGGYCRSNQKLEARLQKYPLLEYAAQHWGDHARGDPEEAIGELSLKFLEHDSKLVCSNQVMHLSEYRYFQYSQIFPRHVTGLHVAASFGLARIAQLLLAHEGVDADPKDGKGRTPLSWAAENGHEKVVQLLLAREGVDADSKDKGGRAPLSWAAGAGHKGVVQLLLAQEGVDASSKDEDGWTPLSRAAGNGNKGVVQLLPAHEGIDANSKDESGRTPLSRAAENGYEIVVQLLLAHEGVDANSKDEFGRTPLLWAAGNGHEMVVQLLLTHEGVNADSKDKDDQAPLSWAARNGHKGVAQLLLTHEGVEADYKDKSSQTPLSRAAENRHEGVVPLLAHRGVDVDSKDESSRTPLSWAARNGHEGVAQLLLAHEGVDANFRDKVGRAPLSWAAENGHEGMSQLLLAREGIDADSKDKDDRAPLSWAAARGNEGVVQLLLAHEGVNADSKDESGRTPLSWAAGNWHGGVVQLLLEHEGVDVDSKNKFGRTPLSWAAGSGCDAVVRLLLAHEGVDANSKDEFGRTPLLWAAWGGYERVVQLLLAHEGIDADSKDEDGQTPLSRAAGGWHEKVVHLLLAHEGVDADSKDKDGRTPLSWAAGSWHEGVVQLLLAQEGVDANSKDEDGRTPLSWAAEIGHEKVVQLLLAHKGIDANSKDKGSRTPLSWAAENGREKVVQLLTPLISDS